MIEVVVVDDETDIFPLFEIKFKKEIKAGKIRFHFFSSAKDLLDFLGKTDKKNFNYIITDIQMPDMSGLDLLQKIKERSSEQEVYIISGHLSSESSQHAKELGAGGFFSKPIDFKKLKETIL